MRRHQTKLFYANKKGIIYGHNIAIIYRRTSTVVYAHNITCAAIHNKMIFDWNHQGGQGGPKKHTHTQPKIYGHDTAQTQTQEPKKPIRMTQSWRVILLKLVLFGVDAGVIFIVRSDFRRRPRRTSPHLWPRWLRRALKPDRALRQNRLGTAEGVERIFFRSTERKRVWHVVTRRDPSWHVVTRRDTSKHVVTRCDTLWPCLSLVPSSEVTLVATATAAMVQAEKSSFHSATIKVPENKHLGRPKDNPRGWRLDPSQCLVYTLCIHCVCSSEII